MNRTLIAVATATALMGMAPAHAATPTLTVYSGDYDAVVQSDASPGGPGFGLFHSTVGFDLASGGNTERLGGLPTALDASSVRLRPLGEAGVRGQRFDFALAGQDALLARAIGQSITVEQAVGDSRQTYTGELLAAGNGLTLRLPDGRVKMLANYASFELASPARRHGGRTDAGLGHPRRPRRPPGLRARLRHRRPRLARGIPGRPVRRRQGLPHGPGGRGDGGEPFGRRLQRRRADPGGRRAESRAVRRPGDDGQGHDDGPRAQRPRPHLARRPRARYHAYRLPGTSALPQGSVQRLPLLDRAQGVACERRYETRAEFGDWRPPQPMIDANFNAPRANSR